MLQRTFLFFIPQAHTVNGQCTIKLLRGHVHTETQIDKVVSKIGKVIFALVMPNIFEHYRVEHPYSFRAKECLKSMGVISRNGSVMGVLSRNLQIISFGRREHRSDFGAHWLGIAVSHEIASSVCQEICWNRLHRVVALAVITLPRSIIPRHAGSLTVTQ